MEELMMSKKIKFKTLKIVITALILLLVIFIILLTQTTVFNVKKITINGNQELSAEKIVTASGIVKGEKIFKVDLKNAKESLLLHPYIEKTDIKRGFPDKISIAIIERQEVGYIKHMDSYIYIGVDGLVLNILKEKKDKEIPSIEGLSIESPFVGSQVIYKNKNNKQSQQITKMLKELNKSNIREEIEKIAFTKSNVDILLNAGTNIAFGPLFNIEYKMRFLFNTLKDIKEKNIKVKNIYLNKSSDIIVEVVDSQEENDED